MPLNIHTPIREGPVIKACTARSEYLIADETGLLFQSLPWFLPAVDDVQIARRWLSAAQVFDAARSLR